MQLEQEGLTFLRFSNDEIRLKPEDVIKQIEIYLKEKTEQVNTNGPKSPL